MTFDEYWHAQPFGWAACDAKTLAEKCYAAGKREAAQHILDVWRQPWGVAGSPFIKLLEAYVDELK